LDLREREVIERGREQGLTVTQIGALLRRSPSTISREIARNGVYRAVAPPPVASRGVV
jgi:IS30 family transposase